ncbi:MAG TPA: ATP-binding protein [Rhodocyclaceae bacterium]|nr:ATP-binding protein [Rhodocyclaceae bacterium]
MTELRPPAAVAAAPDAPAAPADAARIAALEAEIARQKKIVQALMNRAERGVSPEGSDFGLFQTAVILEDQVRERTRELEQALHDNEKMNRALNRAKDQMEREMDERKRANAALEREKDEQKALVAKLEQVMSHLVQTEKLAALGSLVAGVAHELNTPLGNSLTVSSTLEGVVADFSHQLGAGPLRKQALLDFVEHCRTAAAMLSRNSQRAAELIGNFKQVAVDQTSMRRRRFDLRQALDEILSALQPKLKHTRHVLDIAVPPGIMLESYPGPIEQIVTNLLGNSLLHGFEGIASGSVRLDARVVDGGSVLLTYTDNGVGMSEAVARRVFDPFFTTRLGSGGSGLGLYLVYNLTTAVLGGTIQLNTAPGQGVRFELLLPLVAPATTPAQEESYAT